MRGAVLLLALITVVYPAGAQSVDASLELAGVTVTPHVIADSMRYRVDAEPAVGARVQLFLRNGAGPGDGALTIDAQTRALFDGHLPETLLDAMVWAWHDTPTATPDESLSLAPGALTVWTFNGRALPFGPDGTVQMDVGPEDAPWLSRTVEIAEPTCWLSAVTFLGPVDTVHPNSVVVHITNETAVPLEIRSCRLWLPQDPQSPRALSVQKPFPSLRSFGGQATIPSNDRGGFTAKNGCVAADLLRRRGLVVA